MLYFLLRLFVYTFSVAIVMHTVPGLRLQPVPYFGETLTSALGYIVIGMVFAVMRDFVRPVILVLSGRLYIRTFGLLAVFLDVFTFLLITYVVPTEWDIGWARLGSAALGALLMSVLVLLLEALFGFDSPRATQVQTAPLYWRLLAGLPARQRSRLSEGLRTQQIIAIFQSYALDIVMGLSPFGSFRHAMQKRIYRVRARLIERDPAVKLRLMLQQLGPTFVKFGQLVAIRSELVPASWRTELQKLQDEVPPVPYGEIENAVRRELGAAPEEVFASFEREPLAAASTAQVHAATLHSGERVVVKVQRPGIDLVVRSDLAVMQDVVDTASKRFARVRQFGLGPIFREFADVMRLELDFGDEAYKMQLLRHNMESLPFVTVPQVYGPLSTARIITQERMSGVRITDLPALEQAGIDREQKALQFFRALLKQLLFDGFFHADPHPGNVWINPAADSIVFIDMGMMGRLGRAERLALAQLLWALRENDARLAARILRTFCTEDRPEIRSGQDLERDIERQLGRHMFSTETPDFTAVAEELMELLSRHGLRLRREFALGFKTLGQAEAIMTELLGAQPLSAMLDIAYSTLKELLIAQLSPRKLTENVGKPLLSELIGTVPALVGAGARLLDAFERGETTLQTGAARREQEAALLRDTVQRNQQRTVLAISGAGLMMASAFLLSLPPDAPAAVFLARAAPYGLGAGALSTVVLLVSGVFRRPRDRSGRENSS